MLKSSLCGACRAAFSSARSPVESVSSRDARKFSSSTLDTVGKNKKKIQEYIKNQLQQDQIADQLSLKEFVDPFTGSKETKA